MLVQVGFGRVRAGEGELERVGDLAPDFFFHHGNRVRVQNIEIGSNASHAAGSASWR